MTFEEFLWAMGEGQMADSIRSHALSLEPYPAHQEALWPVSPLPGCRRHTRHRGRVRRALAKRQSNLALLAAKGVISFESQAIAQA